MYCRVCRQRDQVSTDKRPTADRKPPDHEQPPRLRVEPQNESVIGSILLKAAYGLASGPSRKRLFLWNNGNIPSERHRGGFGKLGKMEKRIAFPYRSAYHFCIARHSVRKYLMDFTSLLKRLTRGSRGRSAALRTLRFRPRLEAVEARIAPAGILAIGSPPGDNAVVSLYHDTNNDGTPDAS